MYHDFFKKNNDISKIDLVFGEKHHSFDKANG
jgi:hypothetical protein